MYHCTIKFLLAGCSDRMMKIMEDMPPLAGFRHVFTATSAPDEEMAARADVIVAGPELEEADIALLSGAKKCSAELLVVMRKNMPLTADIRERAADVWSMPMSDDELRFRFLRWQEIYKQGKDLWQTNQFLESCLETTPNLVWFKSRDGIHELVNASFCRAVNKTRQQVQGQRHAYIWNVEKDDPACIESERIVMETGRIHVSEETIDTGEGKRLLKTYKGPLVDIDGAMMGTIGVAVDVTKTHEYQEQIARNNSILENIFLTMDCGILCQSLDGEHIISVNDAALKLLGFSSKEQMEGAGFQMIASTVVEEDRPRLRKVIRELKNVGDSASYEYRVLHQDGELFYVMGNAKLVEKDGEVMCQRFLLDCTAQKREEERKRREQEKLQLELVRALSVDYQLVFVVNDRLDNGNILQILDYPDRNLKEVFSGTGSFPEKMRTYIQTCVHPDDRESFRRFFSLAFLKKEIEDKKTCYFNYRVLDGKNFQYFQLKAVRVESEKEFYDIVIGLQSVDTRIREEMEQKKRLGEALVQAQKASNAKSIFLSNMSHDIRTPMNAVAGYASLALSHLDDQNQVEDYLKKILASGNHLVSLINDILEMSHIESGKIRLKEKPCSLPALFQKLGDIIQPMASAKRQNLSLETDSVRDGNVCCDELRLNQVLLNLLSNSIKYTPNGGSISMRVEQLDCPLAAHGTYEFRVRDNGIGMSEEFVARIFEPFERAQTSTVAGIQGTGLGMSITKNIVDMMKGDIRVWSEPNVGTETVFRVTFRLVDNAEDSILQERAENRTGAGSGGVNALRGNPGAGRAVRILLAEDNAMNQEIAAEFLTEAGYLVEIASNGQEAVDKYRNAAPGYYDLILMDVQMPVLDGYGATRSIRAMEDERLSSVPIIAMTANSFEEDRQEALSYGMNGHVAKPIDFKILFETLDRILTQE